jgi:hypothetical protein
MFSPSVAALGLHSPYDHIIEALAGDASTIALVKGIISTESQWNPNAVNPSDPSYGLMQILAGPGGPYPSVPVQDLMDPITNITLGTRFIKELIGRFGYPDAVAAYNAGTPRRNAAGQYVNSRGDTMVQAYVDSVVTYQTWYLNQMLGPDPLGDNGGWVPTADILRPVDSNPVYDAALTVTAIVNDLFSTGDEYAYTDVAPGEFTEPSSSPLFSGMGLAVIILAAGTILYVSRR